jgi:hypothetical protein
MLLELQEITNLYVFSRGRIIVTDGKIRHKPEWGDAFVSGCNDIVHCHTPLDRLVSRGGESRYDNKNTPIWITNPRSGYFVYADYWKTMNRLHNYEDIHKSAFYHKLYVNEMLKNLRVVFVVDNDNRYCVLTVVTHFFIKGMDFFIYFDCRYEITGRVDIETQIGKCQVWIPKIKNYIKSKPFLLVSNVFDEDYIYLVRYVCGHRLLPKEFIFCDNTVFHGGSRTAVAVFKDQSGSSLLN